jgi:hypothetical protein
MGEQVYFELATSQNPSKSDSIIKLNTLVNDLIIPHAGEVWYGEHT